VKSGGKGSKTLLLGDWVQCPRRMKKGRGRVRQTESPRRPGSTGEKWCSGRSWDPKATRTVSSPVKRNHSRRRPKKKLNAGEVLKGVQFLPGGGQYCKEGLGPSDAGETESGLSWGPEFGNIG